MSMGDLAPMGARVRRVVGGETSYISNHPYQVNLKYYEEFVCGGVIINTMLILTAAHCIANRLPRRVKIVAGSSSGNETNLSQTRSIKYFYIHEKYLEDSDANDIALIALERPLEFIDFVEPITLPKEREEFEGYTTVIGWGKLSEFGSEALYLQEARVPIVPNAECKRRYSKTTGKVTENMICSGKTGVGACQGDSGGAVICERNRSSSYSFKSWESKQVLCGLVSFAFNGCSRKDYPAIYTKVSNYVRWIGEKIEYELARKLKTKCRTDHFYCNSSKTCISKQNVCNGKPDCVDGEDEQSCTNTTAPCLRNQFRCNNGLCISKENVCDTFNDCGDRSDEDKCPYDDIMCGDAEFQCEIDGRCLPANWKCDDIQDCDDNSDEATCFKNYISNNFRSDIEGSNTTSVSTDSFICSDDQFRCSDEKICIKLEWVCNGEKDCQSGNDEIGCDENTGRKETKYDGKGVESISTENNLTAFSWNRLTTEGNHGNSDELLTTLQEQETSTVSYAKTFENCNCTSNELDSSFTSSNNCTITC